jgi:hypothetical protein
MPTQLWLLTLLNGGVEAIHIHMDDLAHRNLLNRSLDRINRINRIMGRKRMHSPPSNPVNSVNPV